MMDKERIRKLLPIVLIVVLLASAIILLVVSAQNGSGDKLPEDSNIDSSSQVSIVDGRDVLNGIGSVAGYESLSEDLFIFAKTAYSEYVSTDSAVVFIVSGDITKTGSEVSFEGKFGSVDHNIVIKVNRLKNERISTSITDTSNNLNIDQNLPSNTDRNRFIGTLPLSSTTYLVEYTKSNDGFMITLYTETLAESNAAYSEAGAKILQGLGVASLEYEKVNTQRPSSSFGF